MEKRIWAPLRKYCLQTTVHGLKYFYIYPDYLSRCFWMLIMIPLMVLSFTITGLLYKHFEKMPTRVTIENHFEPMSDLPYPSITVCPPNQITMSSMMYFKRSLISNNLTIDLTSTLPSLLGFYELVDNLNEDDLKQLQNILDQNRFTIPEVMGKIPLSCELFLRRCFMESKVYDCKDLFKPILTAHGYCCSFNSKYYFTGKRVAVDNHFKNRTIVSTGLNSFFSVIADYQAEEVLPGTILNAGSIRVMLTDCTEFPNDYESYLVETNAESFLFLRASYTYCSYGVQLLPWWSRECYFEDERKLPVFKYYHDSDCDLMCYVWAVHHSCNCWLFFLPVLEIKNICKATHIPCIISVKKNMNKWLVTEQCRCPRNCVSRKYSAGLTVGNFDAIPYMTRARAMFAGLKFNKSTSIISFMFTKSTYVKLKQETVSSFVSLISNVGGVLGLFMGCGTLSIFEILFYIFRAMTNCRHQQE